METRMRAATSGTCPPRSPESRGTTAAPDNRHHDDRPGHFGMLVIDGTERSGINGSTFSRAKQNTDPHHVYRAAKAGRRQRYIGREHAPITE